MVGPTLAMGMRAHQQFWWSNFIRFASGSTGHRRGLRGNTRNRSHVDNHRARTTRTSCQSRLDGAIRSTQCGYFVCRSRRQGRVRHGSHSRRTVLSAERHRLSDHRDRGVEGLFGRCGDGAQLEFVHIVHRHHQGRHNSAVGGLFAFLGGSYVLRRCVLELPSVSTGSARGVVSVGVSAGGRRERLR